MERKHSAQGLSKCQNLLAHITTCLQINGFNPILVTKILQSLMEPIGTNFVRKRFCFYRKIEISHIEKLKYLIKKSIDVIQPEKSIL